MIPADASEKQDFSKITVDVSFIRRFLFYLLTIYIPTMMLVIIAYATLFYRKDDFNSRIIVALTALLVLTNLFNQVMSELSLVFLE